MIYLKLYLAFFKIGLFSIGGGYASLPLIEKDIVNYHGWITMEEFTNMLTISQMTPGPIAINTATFVGTQIGGILGGVVATLGCVSPSFIIVIVLAWLYVKYKNMKLLSNILYGLRPAVVSLISIAGISIISVALIKNYRNFHNFDLNYISVVVFIISLVLLKKFKISPIIVMIICGILGVIAY